MKKYEPTGISDGWLFAIVLAVGILIGKYLM